jgi:hypothetical protein
MSPTRILGCAALAGLIVMPTMASAQDFSKLACPTLIEMRMEMLVRYGFCPRDRFYGRLFKEQAQGCDRALGDFQVQERILNEPAVDEQDKQRMGELLRSIQRNNCQL